MYEIKTRFTRFMIPTNILKRAIEKSEPILCNYKGLKGIIPLALLINELYRAETCNYSRVTFNWDQCEPEHY